MVPVVTKSLSRLSRDSLVNLCLQWSQSQDSIPYLASNRNLLESDEEDYLHEPAETVAKLKKLYRDLKQSGNEREDLSKREIIDRIVDGDWRRGLSLQQLADIDLANLEQSDTALRWSALKLVPLKSSTEDPTSSYLAKKRKISPSNVRQPHYPTISPANFVANLKSHISPLVKTHYTLHRLQPSNLVILRLYIVPNTPFAPLSSNITRNVRQATDSSRVMYIALPDSCPYVYISLSGSTGSTIGAKSKDARTVSTTKIDIAATKRVILESIPKALSKPQERWSLENTKLTCRSLKAIGLLRGNTRPGTAGGCYSKFSEEYQWTPSLKSQVGKPESDSTEAEPTPLTVSPPPAQQSSLQESTQESLVSTRFGRMTTSSHASLDRFHITVTDLLAPPPTSKPTSQAPRRSKRKRRSLEDIETGRDIPADTIGDESKMKAKIEPVQFSLSFSGTDVFRGLKELALIEGGRYVDLVMLPGWGTGERGVSGLVV